MDCINFSKCNAHGEPQCRTCGGAYDVKQCPFYGINLEE